MDREKVIEELKILKEDYWVDDGYGHETKQYEDTMFALDMAIEALEFKGDALSEIEKLPSVTPTCKKGRWIPMYGNVKCSVCGNTKDGRSVGKATHYCDFCGAKMEVE